MQHNAERQPIDRRQFVERQIEGRGVRDPLVLDAMRAVPRETFVPHELAAEAYDDTPLPIGARQTISQPYIVAFMIEALGLRGGEKVLEIGSGSGYAAAVLAQIAGDVYTIQRIGELAALANRNLAAAGCGHVHVRHADGTQGWQQEAPFDAILVSAGAPDVPGTLLHQLKIGGRIVVPIGDNPRAQELVRITRTGDDDFEQEDIADVRFVPLIGKEGWETAEDEWEVKPPRVVRARPAVSISVPSLIAKHSQIFTQIRDAKFEPLLDRIGNARVVLIGEASHGTSEFYRMRARITQRLIEEKGYSFVAAEADWPDAARIDHYARHRNVPPSEWTAFARFPTWMWRNAETRNFVDWLHKHNETRSYDQRAAFYGLDLYSLYNSVRVVLTYLDAVDPELAAVARERYGCLSPWEADPSAYGRAALSGAYRECEQEVSHVLVALLQKQQAYAMDDGERFFDAAQNARLISNAERYYRTMYYGSRASWNLRDSHMFETLNQLLEHHGASSKAVIWAHNSHIGDALGTEMSRRGEHNIGQLCRRNFGTDCYSIGFGTNDGTVAAASNWDAPMQVMNVQPAHAQSYERLFHLTNAPGLMLPLQEESELREKLLRPLLERAIGVIYRPESELASHYFEATLPLQFDEYIWIDRTSAVKPLDSIELEGMPETYPFGV
ncbi:protein-L-isoaspartate(D-aspartate) O-methyltransferase [Hyphomicrobium sp.]|uniref:protein-L-isoaspartate(D-aspartate) O-methyltransferase n=1 Tax=Hyphomicrobium sp. TaxID=82 RepID=UPI002D779044|nr:protein-L-isoaspartate(D-aspartate) O-methyltransferase [Hyphomicrobium sp.]HET6389187.1 protein-L-isoaspartate(D-aspartate) O-methyltransferase [Hyphomicrobium sp.]